MNIFIKEFKFYLKPLLIWCGAIVSVHLVASIEFGVFANEPSIIEAMEQFEQVFQALGSSVTDITTPEGFLSLISIYIVLPLAIYSGLLGSSIISKEEKDKTAEFMFTLPVSRRKVLLYKLLLSIVNSIIINLFLVIVILLIYTPYEPSSSFYTFLQNISIGTFLIQLIFISVGIALSSVLKYYKQSSNITISILITTFMINILMGFVDDVDFLRFFTPFKYYSADNMLAGTFEPVYLIITALLIVFGTATLFVFYPKRDLYI